MRAKVVHVLSEARKGSHNHRCHWPGCEKKVPPAMWGCKYHWGLLPSFLRNRIWNTYEAKQEISKTPSRDYIDAAHEVQVWIRDNFLPTERGLEYDL